jgi:hypothetical protein
MQAITAAGSGVAPREVVEKVGEPAVPIMFHWDQFLNLENVSQVNRVA